MWKKYRRLLVGVVAAIVLLGIFTAGWLFLKTGKQSLTGAQAEKFAVRRVSKLMILPTGEKPALITVVNRNSIQNIPFLANAKNGDEMLVYYKAKIVILYRPSINKIVNVGPVQLPATPSHK